MQAYFKHWAKPVELIIYDAANRYEPVPSRFASDGKPDTWQITTALARIKEIKEIYFIIPEPVTLFRKTYKQIQFKTYRVHPMDGDPYTDSFASSRYYDGGLTDAARKVIEPKYKQLFINYYDANIENIRKQIALDYLARARADLSNLAKGASLTALAVNQLEADLL